MLQENLNAKPPDNAHVDQVGQQETNSECVIDAACRAKATELQQSQEDIAARVCYMPQHRSVPHVTSVTSSCAMQSQFLS